METGRELLLNVFAKKPVSRPCWILYPGLHAGSLLDYDSFDLFTNEEKLLNSLLAINKLYKPDGLPVIFDLQLESEILGCELAWNSKSVPMVKTHPLELNKNTFLPIPKPTDGRLPLALGVTRKLKKLIGAETAIYGLVTGPLTLAFQLRGMLIFMDLYDDTVYFERLLTYCTEVCKHVSNYYLYAGADVIGIIDPLLSQISADIFTTFLSGSFRDIYNNLRSQNMRSSMIVCGEVSHLIEEMAKTSPDCISVDGSIDLPGIKEIAGKFNLTISGNIPINNILIQGNQLDCQSYTVDLIEAMKDSSFILAPGCDLPYNVPIQNLLGISQVVQNYQDSKLFLNENQLIKKGKTTKRTFKSKLIEIEVFSINSTSVSVCDEVLNEISKYTNDNGIPQSITEYDVSTKNGLTAFKNYKLQNIPTILINGVICYQGTAPKPLHVKRILKRILN